MEKYIVSKMFCISKDATQLQANAKKSAFNVKSVLATLALIHPVNGLLQGANVGCNLIVFSSLI